MAVVCPTLRLNRLRLGLAVASVLAGAGCASRPGGEARVAFDTGGVITQAAHGHAAPSRAFTPATLVRVASVSKLVTTIGAMRLVEAGTLDLDADVSATLGWPLRNPAFPDMPVTLRQLLSHTSGLVDVGDDYAVPLGQTLRAAIGPANWSPHAPGTWFRYTNYNFPVVAEVMERATGERFDRLMVRLVLAPLGIDACYNWAMCSDAGVAGAAVLTDARGHPVKDDLHGHRPDCAGVNRLPGAACSLDAYRPGDNGAVFSPQGGLRISALGLARIGRLLLDDGSVGGVRLLAPATVALMRTPQWRWNGHDGETEGGMCCAWGLGIHLLGIVPGCRDGLAGDGRPRFGHSGEAYHLRSGLWLDSQRHRGVAFVVTAVTESPPKDPESAFTAVEHRLAKETIRTRDNSPGSALVKPSSTPSSTAFRRALQPLAATR
ncbi:MAG: serine hydrolase domain-containing protein [Janthinobacterium lividum]